MERDQIHFKCQKEDGTNFTLNELIYVLETTKEGLEYYYRKYHQIENANELNSLSPEIVAVRNGCIDFTVITQGVIANVLSSLIVFVGKKIFSYVKNSKIFIILRKSNPEKCSSLSKKSDNVFNSIGASFFVSYLYYFLIDKKHINWKLIQNSNGRISNINSNYCLWKKWLNQVLKMNDKKLNTNHIRLNANAIKSMANDLLRIL